MREVSRRRGRYRAPSMRHALGGMGTHDTTWSGCFRESLIPRIAPVSASCSELCGRVVCLYLPKSY